MFLFTDFISHSVSTVSRMTDLQVNGSIHSLHTWDHHAHFSVLFDRDAKHALQHFDMDDLQAIEISQALFGHQPIIIFIIKYFD